jgi:hypothetical protein
MNDNSIKQSREFTRNSLLNHLEGMAIWMYSLPDQVDLLHKDDLLQIQMSAERLESRLNQTLDWLARETGRKRK